MSRAAWICWSVIGLIAGVIVLTPMGLANIFAGWVVVVGRIWETATIDIVAVLSGVACALIVGLGIHAVGNWLLRSGGGAGRRWPVRWTAASLAALLLLFASGMAAAALARHVLWLASSSRPLTGDCLSNLSRISLAIHVYAQYHDGRFPERLEDICTLDLINRPDIFVCPNSSDEPPASDDRREWASWLSSPGHCSYVYLGRGLVDPVPAAAERPLVYEARANHRGVNILFADGHVMWMPAEYAETILAKPAGTTAP